MFGLFEDKKIKQARKYFNFIISLIDSRKYTDKNTISNIEMNITEYFLNKKVIDLYGL